LKIVEEIGCRKKHSLPTPTRARSTAEIAEGIAKVLRDPSLDVEVWPVHDVKSLTGFDAVILGTPIRMGRPHPDIKRFVRRFKKEIFNFKVAFLWHA
jgi:menaquinone-dependent protoporphyrinogen oxidase